MKTEKSKKLSSIQAIIAPLNEGYEERAQHWGCRIHAVWITRVLITRVDPEEF